MEFIYVILLICFSYGRTGEKSATYVPQGPPNEYQPNQQQLSKMLFPF